MKEKGVKIFGVETISPDLVYLTDEYPTHRACAETEITHYENLNNLKDVVNRRFDFYAFPLRLVPAAGSPVRAVGIVEGLAWTERTSACATAKGPGRGRGRLSGRAGRPVAGRIRAGEPRARRVQRASSAISTSA